MSIWKQSSFGNFKTSNMRRRRRGERDGWKFVQRLKIKILLIYIWIIIRKIKKVAHTKFPTVLNIVLEIARCLTLFGLNMNFWQDFQFTLKITKIWLQNYVSMLAVLNIYIHQKWCHPLLDKNYNVFIFLWSNMSYLIDFINLTIFFPIFRRITLFGIPTSPPHASSFPWPSPLTSPPSSLSWDSCLYEVFLSIYLASPQFSPSAFLLP